MGLCYVMLYWMYLQTKAIYNKTIDKINVCAVNLLKMIIVNELYEPNVDL